MPSSAAARPAPPTAYQRAITHTEHIARTTSNIRRLLELDARPEVPALANIDAWIGVVRTEIANLESAIKGLRREQRLRKAGMR